jgi:hypothetical protein
MIREIVASLVSKPSRRRSLKTIVGTASRIAAATMVPILTALFMPCSPGYRED